MSSTSTIESTIGPEPSSSPDNGGGNNNQQGLLSPTQTNVYLYGFLSVLILIFIVSVAVAYKGYRTRMLIRQRIDEALAAGVFIPGFSRDGTRDGHGGAENLGPKPILHEVWVGGSAGGLIGDEKWNTLLPFSAAVGNSLEAGNDEQQRQQQQQQPPSFAEWAQSHPITHTDRRWRPFRRTQSRPQLQQQQQQPPSHDPRHPPLSPPPPESAPGAPGTPSNPSQPVNDPLPIHLGFLILMPKPHNAHNQPSTSAGAVHEDDLPELTLAYTDIDLTINNQTSMPMPMPTLLMPTPAPIPESSSNYLSSR